MYDLLQIYPIPNGPIITPSMSWIIPSVQQNATTNNSNSDLVINDKGKSTVDKFTFIGNNSKSTTPPFLLTFKIFNGNVYNCMVDSGASTNVIPLSICRKLNSKYVPSDS